MYTQEIGRIAGAAPAARPRPAPTPVAGRPRGRAGGRAGTARGAPRRRSGPRRARRRRAGCRRSCAGSGGRRRRRTRRARPGRPARSCWRRPCTPGRRASCTIAQISRIVLLEHAVGRGVGDHQRGQARRACCVGLGARGRRGRRCRRRRRPTTTTRMPAITALAGLVPWADDGDQADVAVRLAAARVAGADRQQAGVLALRAGVGLQRHRGVAGDLAPASASSSSNSCCVARGLVARREGVELRRTRAR